MTEFEVFRGPGNRLVAISLNTVRSEWQVRSGTQGSRLRISTLPIADYPSRDDVKASLLTGRYVHEFTGEIDAHGAPLRSTSSRCLFWNASGIPIDELTKTLIFLKDKANDVSVDVRFTQDASGTFFSIGQNCFGITTSSGKPGFVSTVNRKGSGSLYLDDSSVLAAFAVYCSRSFHDPERGVSFTLAASVDATLSADQILDLIAPSVSSTESDLFELLGLRSLSLILKSRSIKHRISF